MAIISSQRICVGFETFFVSGLSDSGNKQPSILKITMYALNNVLVLMSPDMAKQSNSRTAALVAVFTNKFIIRQ